MTAKWQDERPNHGIVLLQGSTLLCSCGVEVSLAGKDLALSQRIQYDMLLDRHAAHRKGKTK